MATHESIRNDIMSAFDTAWTALANGIAVEYPNAPVAAAQPDNDDAWLRVGITTAFGVRLTGIGETSSDHRGLFVAEAFTPLGQGDAQALQLLDAVNTICQGQTLGAASFLDGDHVVVGRDFDGRWWKENLSFPFIFESTP